MTEIIKIIQVYFQCINIQLYYTYKNKIDKISIKIVLRNLNLARRLETYEVRVANTGRL